jgi:penicillin amidase
VDSAGAALFYEAHRMLAERVFGSRMSSRIWQQLFRPFGLHHYMDGMLGAAWAEKWFDDPETVAVETCDQAVAVAVATAVASLRESSTDDPASWSWGRLHRLTFRHPLGRAGVLERLLNRGPFPVGGGNSTVNLAAYVPNRKDGPYRVRSGPSMRTVVDLGDVDAARMVITLGQSESRFSSHYADQLPLWRSGDMLPLWRGDRIDDHLEGRLILKPASPGDAPSEGTRGIPP